jgi:hypothetical protein
MPSGKVKGIIHDDDKVIGSFTFSVIFNIPSIIFSATHHGFDASKRAARANLSVNITIICSISVLGIEWYLPSNGYSQQEANELVLKKKEKGTMAMIN